jgi:NADPH-dependent 7-cyano-7-deazaguanine reductase QueF
VEGRFLDSDAPGGFTALGRAGSDAYVGLETFDNPGCSRIAFSGDELVAHCPVTGQPDFYTWEIVLADPPKSIESKSLKLWLRQFADPNGPGLFCEALAVFIRDRVGEALGYDEQETFDKVQVSLTQKSRGGISIRSVA